MKTLVLLLLLCSPASAIDWAAWGNEPAAPVQPAPRTVSVGGQRVEVTVFVGQWYERGRRAGWHNPAGQSIAAHLRQHGFSAKDIAGMTTEEMTKLHIAHHAWEAAQTAVKASTGRWVQQRVCTGRGRCTYRMVWVQ